MWFLRKLTSGTKALPVLTSMKRKKSQLQVNTIYSHTISKASSAYIEPLGTVLDYFFLLIINGEDVAFVSFMIIR